ncbi:MAG: hypothetical protein AAF228_11735 [Pseudomonadota bacterium]
MKELAISGDYIWWHRALQGTAEPTDLIQCGYYKMQREEGAFPVSIVLDPKSKKHVALVNFDEWENVKLAFYMIGVKAKLRRFFMTLSTAWCKSIPQRQVPRKL